MGKRIINPGDKVRVVRQHLYHGSDGVVIQTMTNEKDEEVAQVEGTWYARYDSQPTHFKCWVNFDQLVLRQDRKDNTVIDPLWDHEDSEHCGDCDCCAELTATIEKLQKELDWYKQAK